MYSTCIVWLAFIPIFFGANHDYQVSFKAVVLLLLLAFVCGKNKTNCRFQNNFRALSLKTYYHQKPSFSILLELVIALQGTLTPLGHNLAGNYPVENFKNLYLPKL